MPINKESRCIFGLLHRFKIVREWPEGVEEICQICKQRKLFKVVQGKINHLEYLKYHNREALPKHHPLYEREYGNKNNEFSSRIR